MTREELEKILANNPYARFQVVYHSSIIPETVLEGTVSRIYNHSDRAVLLVDKRPEFWPYPTLEFAPLISQLEKIDE